LRTLTLETLKSKIYQVTTNPEHRDPKKWVMKVIDTDQCAIETDENVADAFEGEDEVSFTVDFEKRSTPGNEPMDSEEEISNLVIKGPPATITDLQVVELYPDKCVLTWNDTQIQHLKCVYFVMAEKKEQSYVETLDTGARVMNLSPDTTYEFYIISAYYHVEKGKKSGKSPTLNHISVSDRSKSAVLRIHTPSIDRVEQHKINANASVDSNTFTWTPGIADSLILSWKCPTTFCGKISYDLINQGNHIGRVYKLPCTLKVEKFVGHGRLHLSIQTVIADIDKEWIKSDNCTTVSVSR